MAKSNFFPWSRGMKKRRLAGNLGRVAKSFDRFVERKKTQKRIEKERRYKCQSHKENKRKERLLNGEMIPVSKLIFPFGAFHKSRSPISWGNHKSSSNAPILRLENRT
jgi:hypothetical protein